MRNLRSDTFVRPGVLGRLLSLFITLALVSLIVAAIFALIPGDPVTLLTGTSASPEQVEALRERLHLGDHIASRYFFWLQHAVRGNFGESIRYAVPVRTLIFHRLSVTATLAAMAAFLVILVSLPLAIFLVRSRNRAVRGIIDNTLLVGLSVPNYITGILFIWVFGILLRFFAPGNFVPFAKSPALYFRAVAFPAIAVAVPNICMLTRFLAGSIRTELEKDYVRTARSKGGTSGYILYRHVLKNAALPAVTLSGILLADILSGSIILEQVFAVPGIGRLLISGINGRDFPVVITIVLYTSFVVVVVNFIAESLTRRLDARTKGWR
ncbi:MAG: ABC transporter permease [Spirochaetaceae bacterium]|jgi:ABC-type dipeptide/oligopeptide/nickel transport system permease component|nr:ABC transporter permease [Spirochaetaceae bacterium]